MKWRALDAEPCSIARTLSFVGDRWSLLVLRDCFLRVRRFEEFQRRLGVTRHILADRLKRFVEADILTRVAYQSKPERHEYVLTEKGLALYPVLMAMARWGDTYMDDGAGPPLRYRHRPCGRHFTPVMCCSECGEPLDPRSVIVEPGPGLDADAARLLPPTPQSALRKGGAVS
ncbi:transcriptional regulator [Camelimonas fluminis]|uniref:Winged helix-turn-helix transcriptional regulator n=1 Tax=Camelimonas fluminis TaxID=1576911 RepID=A0ABV7UJ18_9HYPH|nr:helix-turn-helix domain-containing protein [Camelimonas fluminis]GHE67956.1 transcriptional regulator [Camelimonas fluminis]